MSDFFRFEDKEYDMPFLGDDPRFTTKNVIILLVGLLIASSISFIIPVTGNTLLKAIIMCIAPLLTVIYVFKDDMSNICRMPKARDFLIIIVGFVLMYIFSIIAKLIVFYLGFTLLTDTAVNGEPTILIIRAVIQLIGEELIKFIPLIIVTAYLYKSVGRKTAIIIAIIVSQILFALNHIPAYGFSILYLIITIGISSLALPFIYVKTKNLTLCYIVHLLYDLVAFMSLL